MGFISSLESYESESTECDEESKTFHAEVGIAYGNRDDDISSR